MFTEIFVPDRGERERKRERAGCLELFLYLLLLHTQSPQICQRSKSGPSQIYSEQASSPETDLHSHFRTLNPIRDLSLYLLLRSGSQTPLHLQPSFDPNGHMKCMPLSALTDIVIAQKATPAESTRGWGKPWNKGQPLPQSFWETSDRLKCIVTVFYKRIPY
jgi:hypothetical protein